MGLLNLLFEGGHSLFSDESLMSLNDTPLFTPSFLDKEAYPFPITKKEPDTTIFTAESLLPNLTHKLPSILDMAPVENDSDIFNPAKLFRSGSDKGAFSCLSASSSSSYLLESSSSNLSSPVFSPSVHGMITRRLSAFLDQKRPLTSSTLSASFSIPPSSPSISPSPSPLPSKSTQLKKVDSKAIAKKKALRKTCAKPPPLPEPEKTTSKPISPLPKRENEPRESTPDDTGLNSEVSEEKREKSRLAAAKYRQKGREMVITLERRLNLLVHENCNLKSRNLRMEEEVVYLREIISNRDKE